jgi:Protein of unknown function (DUF2946)
MRSKRWQTHFAYMALLAMLLLSFAPSVSRYIASVRADSNSTWAEMCTMTGLKLVKVSDFASPQTPKPKSMGDDCVYCPLAASIAPLLLLIVVMFPRIASALAGVIRQTVHHRFLYPIGLGSRGPPFVL